MIDAAMVGILMLGIPWRHSTRVEPLYAIEELVFFLFSFFLFYFSCDITTCPMGRINVSMVIRVSVIDRCYASWNKSHLKTKTCNAIVHIYLYTCRDIPNSIPFSFSIPFLVVTLIPLLYAYMFLHNGEGSLDIYWHSSFWRLILLRSTNPLYTLIRWPLSLRWGLSDLFFCSLQTRSQL